MTKLRGMTAGEAEDKIRQDRTVYKAMEVAEAACHDIMQEVEKCASSHHDIIEDSEFFVIMLIGDDNVLKTVTRRKFYAYHYLPQPRPNQSVWMYSKASRSLMFIWALPEPMTMAALSTMMAVDPAYQNMKMWSDWFYSGKFSQHVRKHFQKPDWLTEGEYLAANRAELSQAVLDKDSRLGTNPLDSTNVDVQNLIDACKPGSSENIGDAPRQA